ncbi:MAG: 4-alpha-glucanotransferase [Bifidobacteriaceae bacterium]|jgi:4-alpha-glucanotransferase|nr:4-alpha-glucanotransferase [Bifidobacteriaceae bacterium]
MPKKDKRKSPIIKLAQKYNIGTFFIGPKKKFIEISESNLGLILQAFGVDTSSDEAIEEAIAEIDLKPWRTPLAPTIHKSVGEDIILDFYIPKGNIAVVTLVKESGDKKELYRLDSGKYNDVKIIDGFEISHMVQKYKDDIEPGYHKIVLEVADNIYTSYFIVTPNTIDLPSYLKEHKRWGYMSQFYSVRSTTSWGVGDFEDLAISCEKAAGENKADFMLINPTHAAEPLGHITPSPYLPSSRLFLNNIYIRPNTIPEFNNLSPDDKVKVAKLFKSVSKLNLDANYIDRDKSWQAKIEALKIIYASPLDDSRKAEFVKYKTQEGDNLEGFAIWSMLYEKWGVPTEDETAWTKVYTINDEKVQKMVKKHQSIVEFYKWLQWIAEQQLSNAQSRAKAAGMKLGIIADLAVGVHPLGADVFANRQNYIYAATVGAPPDLFNQLGQNWSQPPLSPIALEQTGYEPFKTLVKRILKNVGAVRIDHILGMFRLWYIPEKHNATDGAFVYYNHHIMIGILCLEAMRNGAIIIGEDMGMITPLVKKYLKSHGLLGTNVVWEERTKNDFKKVKKYRKLAIAAVTNHDFPPTAGYLEYEHAKLRNKLGLLTEPYEVFLSKVEADVNKMLKLLRKGGFLKIKEPTTEEIVLALHRMLASSPSLLICSTFVDAVGEKRVQNQPGTNNEYPNWRIPLANSQGQEVLLDNLWQTDSLKRLADVINQTIYENN